jgi:glucose/arabinose dehydrogenase
MRRACWCFCVILAMAACDEDPPQAPDMPGPGGGNQITGNERIGWQQAAPSAAELATFRYNIYVDNVPTEIQGVSCAATDGDYSCSGRLPSMSAGRHVLEITTFVEIPTRLESAKSPPLTVTVSQSVMTGGSTPASAIVTADGIRLSVVSLTAGLEDPTDFAVAPDGRIFISERTGRIRIFRDGKLQTAAVAIDDVVATERRGLLALALDPYFEKTGHVYAAYTAATGFRLVRYRASGDTLGDRAILVEGIEATLATPAAALRFGPDRKLYLGVDDAGDPSRPGDLGSFNGKVLRLNLDGTTPDDQAAGTPVYALNVNAPRGLDWDGATLWIAESLRLQGVAETSASARRAAAMVNYRLPAGIDPEGLAFYAGSLIPGLAGDLLVASAEGGAILRLRFDPDNRRRIVSSEYLVPGAVGPIQAIAAPANGIVYFSTMTELFMIAPEPDRNGVRQ